MDTVHTLLFVMIVDGYQGQFQGCLNSPCEDTLRTPGIFPSDPWTTCQAIAGLSHADYLIMQTALLGQK